MATDKELKAKLSWKARSMAISAIDIAEGIGIDTDGDGDLSGFDGSRPTMADALNQASKENEESKPWMIIGQETDAGNLTDSELGVGGFAVGFVVGGTHKPDGVGCRGISFSGSAHVAAGPSVRRPRWVRRAGRPGRAGRRERSRREWL